LPIYFCPSDRYGLFINDPDTITRSRGNYALSLSNGFYVQIPQGNVGKAFPDGVIAPGLTPGPNQMAYGPSPFSLPYTPPFYDQRHRLREVTDGVSHTLFLSEQVQATNDADADVRGDMLNNRWSGGQFMTVNTPNAGTDHTVCDQNPQLPGPCSFDIGDNDFLVYVSARSRHPGGVHALFADGSVHFVIDEINVQTWQALGTMSGGETISASALNF
jgi:prepilin-type processing-associated H-X9-DG protein